MEKEYWLNHYDDGTVELSTFAEFDCVRNEKISKETAELWMYYIGEICQPLHLQAKNINQPHQVGIS